MNLTGIVLEHLIVGGVMMGCAAALLCMIVKRGNVAWPDAIWLHEHVTYIVYAPAITVLGAGAVTLVSMGIKRWPVAPVPAEGLALAGGAVVVTVIACVLLSRVLVASSGARRDAAQVAAARG